METRKIQELNLFASPLARGVIGVGLVALIVASRLLPHEPNFTAVGAAELFAGVFLGGFWAPLIPIAGLLASDYMIGGYGIRGMVVVYAAFLLSFFVGKIIAHGKVFLQNGNFLRKTLRFCGGTLLGAALFFLITNNIFLYTPALYSYDFSGMIQSYIAGIPFFRNQLIGDFVFGAALFGAAETARVWVAKWRAEKRHSLVTGK